MVVASIVITTIIVFVLVDLLLRIILRRAREAQLRKTREKALQTGLRLDVSAEAPTLKRVELDDSRARILAVDDEAIVLDSFRKILVLGGYSIDTVETGPEALGLIRKGDYDFVFTDLKMPDMDGVEVTKAVRHLRPDIDVVIITGYGSVETAVETVRAGAVDYVQKPFTESELLDFVDAALIRRREQQAKQARHRIRLLRPGTGESRSRFELNVPAGAFVSPQHAGATIGLNGMVRVGPDDLIRKIFGPVDRVDLPDRDRKIRKGEPLFAVTYGDFQLKFASPFSGTVVRVNREHADHPEWLAAKPFELSWVCGIEPSNLAADLQGLRIGQDAVDWYQQELDRYSDLLKQSAKTADPNRAADRAIGPGQDAERLKLLAGFARPFQQC
jgi:CheY-like chemotaxis protein